MKPEEDQAWDYVCVIRDEENGSLTCTEDNGMESLLRVMKQGGKKNLIEVGTEKGWETRVG